MPSTLFPNTTVLSLDCAFAPNPVAELLRDLNINCHWTSLQEQLSSHWGQQGYTLV